MVKRNNLFVIIDGNSLMHRAFHALPALTNSDGIFTNAVYGFLMMLLKIIEEESPSYIAVAFDLHGPTFRHKDYADYKAGRKPTAPELVPQFDLLRECLENMHISILTCPSFEADDILGTVARICEENSVPAVLVTGDRDSMQLVSETTTVLYTKKGVTEVIRYTPSRVQEDFGVLPEYIPDLKGLMGDASDHIPGVPGIGEKTAVKLLRQYGTLENVFEHADQDLKGKQREKLIEGRTSGLMSKKLATIVREVPLDSFSFEEFTRYRLSEGIPFLNRLDMKSLVVRIRRLEPQDPELADEQSNKTASGTRLYEQKSLSAWINASLRDGSFLAVLLRSDGIWLGSSVSETAFIPFREGLIGEGMMPEEAVRCLLSVIPSETHLLLYNAKRLKTTLHEWGFELSFSYDDEQLLQYLLQPQISKYPEPENACELIQFFERDLKRVDEQDMRSLYQDIELPLADTLYAMEREGFLVDRGVLSYLGEQYQRDISALTQEIYTLSGGEPFNLNSTAKLGEVLYGRLGLPAKKKTSKGYSTDADSLQSISDLHPIINKILLYRQITKLQSTYIEGLLHLIGKDGRIHTWFDQTTTATGRISSSEPNLQNIPVRTEAGREIRRAFIARDGYTLVDADYSQIELRLLAHLSGDAAMCDAFLRNQDIHARTAAEVFGVPLEQVTPQMRSSAKAVNFGIVYGISDFGLASNLHISRKEAASFISRYFERYPLIHAYMEECVSTGRADGYSRTMFKRRRPLPELSSSNYTQRQFGERVAMNTPVQGSAADIIKIAMNAVYKRIQELGLRAKLILQVHDELIVESPDDEVDIVARLLRECMEGAVTLRIPLVAEIHTGKSWAEAK